MPPQQTSDLAAWLDFLKAFVWPSVIIAGLLLFRKQILMLVERLASIKIGETEVEFQKLSPEATAPKGEAVEEIISVGPGGFFTSEGIKNLVISSGLLMAGEKVSQAILIFSTTKQKTWLVITNHNIYCLLDDENTRATGKIIQWVQIKTEASPVKARQYKRSVGLLGIGSRTKWLYSTALYSTPEALEETVKKALTE